MRGLLLAFTLLLGACAAPGDLETPEPLVLEATEDIPREALLEAVSLWQQEAPGRLELAEGPGHPRPWRLRAGSRPEGRAGGAQRQRRVLVVDLAQTHPSQLGHVIAHEIGHALGLEHVDAPGIMQSHAGTVVEFSPADRAECARAGVCTGGAQ